MGLPPHSAWAPACTAPVTPPPPSLQAIIAFFFEYASQEKYKALGSSMLLLPGAVSFLLATLGSPEAALILEPLQVTVWKSVGREACMGIERFFCGGLRR